MSAPHAVTPLHDDSEHNFLLQIEGHKTVGYCVYEDTHKRQEQLDRYFDGLKCDFEDMQAKGTSVELDPGDGLYIPAYVPHWVENGAAVSVSFSIPFYTKASEDAELVQRANARLRRLRLNPRPPGASPRIDRVKAAVYGSIAKLSARKSGAHG
jgi:ribosomal protein L16 Arg81 hydroxylase